MKKLIISISVLLLLSACDISPYYKFDPKASEYIGTPEWNETFNACCDLENDFMICQCANRLMFADTWYTDWIKEHKDKTYTGLQTFINKDPALSKLMTYSINKCHNIEQNDGIVF